MLNKRIFSKVVLIVLFGVVAAIFGTKSVVAVEGGDLKKDVVLNKKENVCDDRLGERWQARMKGYERAKEARRAAFARMQERWGRLLIRLSESKVDTTTLKVDVANVVTKFNALIAADDVMMTAMKTHAQAVCDKTGIVEAKTALTKAQMARREARKNYNEMLKRFHESLAKIRKSIKK